MALTKLPGFTLDSTSSFTFANANVTANLSAGNVLTNNILYANGTAWSFGSTYSNTNVAAYLPTYTGNITTGNLLTDNLLYANGVAWSFGSTYSNTNVAAYLPTYTGNVTANYFIGDGSTLTSITGANVSGYVPLANTANTATSATTAGTVTTAAQPNITSVGTLSNLSVSGNITTGNLVTTGTSGNISGANYIVANYFVGDGSLLTGLPASYANSNVANYLPTYTGNVSAGNVKTDNLLYANGVAWSFSNYSNTNVAAYLPTYTGNLTAGNANISGNITASSIVTSGSSGNISGANYIVANYFSGNGSLLTSITGADVTGYVPLANAANTATSATTAGTVTTAAQPNITSVGTLSSVSVSGDATITGNLTVSGTYTYANVTSFIVKDPIIEQGGNPNGTPLSSNDGKDRGQILHYYSSSAIDAFMGWDNSNSEFGFGSNVSVSSEVVTWNSYGNIRAGYFIGNGATLTDITGANVTGYVATASAANTAATVTTNAQPNITSVGTLTSLTASGLITATSGGIKVGNLQDPSGTNTIQLLNSNISVTGNIVAGSGGTGNVTATYFIGNGSTLTNITGANVTGYVATATTANTAGTVTTAAQPNITSVGTLSSLSVTANTSSGNILTDNLLYANGVAWSFSNYSNTNVAAYLPTYTGNLSSSNLSVSTSANLGAVGNITITGGTSGYVLTTDGSGGLSWAAQSGGSGTAINVDNFTGDGSNTAFTLSATPSGVNNVIVNYNGAFVSRSSYSVSGATLTFGSAPASGSSIEVSIISGLGTGSATFNTRTATGDGSTANYTVTSGATVSTVLATIDGVLQTPTTDYTIASTTLTFTTAPYNGAAIQIRELGVAVSSSSGSALLIQDEGSNLTATANTINFVGSGVTATNVGNVVTVTVSGASNTSIRAQAMTMGIIFGG